MWTFTIVMGHPLRKNRSKMPFGERNHPIETFARFDESRQEDECDARRIVRPSRSDLAFDVTRELLSEEEVLGRQLRSGMEHQPQQAQEVSEQSEGRSEHVWR
jgi:hypothetical protein